MSKLSNRQKWPIPDKDTNPWQDPFEALVQAMDASAYASREDRNLVLMGGGNVSFNSGTGQVSWTAAIDILSPVTGFRASLAIGNVTLSDGQVAYLELTRYPNSNVALTLTVANNLSLATADNALLFAVRNGSRVYFRDGKVINGGETLELFQKSGTGGGSIGAPGEHLRRWTAIATGQSTDLSSYQSLAIFPLNVADLAITTTTVAVRFMAVGSVTNSATTGNIRLYNLTDATTVATHSFTGVGETAPTKKISAALGLPAGEKLYEVRISVTGGAAPADKVFAWWAGLQIDNDL